MKTALITGASSGIGLELSKLFASNNINLILIARSENRLRELKSELENQNKIIVEILALDLSLADSIEKIVNFTETEKIKVDYLVNNAGFGDFGFFHEANWNKTKQMIDLNISALTALCYHFSKEMVKQKSGKILNIASTASFQPGPLMAVYFATKSYVLHFSEAINNELNDFGITVTAYCPGPTESGFQNAAAMEESKMVKNKKLPSSKEVALDAYGALMKGKPVKIHGFMNTILANAARFTPRNLTVKIVRYLQQK